MCKINVKINKPRKNLVKFGDLDVGEVFADANEEIFIKIGYPGAPRTASSIASGISYIYSQNELVIKVKKCGLRVDL